MQLRSWSWFSKIAMIHWANRKVIHSLSILGEFAPEDTVVGHKAVIPTEMPAHRSVSSSLFTPPVRAATCHDAAPFWPDRKVLYPTSHGWAATGLAPRAIGVVRQSAVVLQGVNRGLEDPPR
jgi:hypothetical protein